MSASPLARSPWRSLSSHAVRSERMRAEFDVLVQAVIERGEMDLFDSQGERLIAHVARRNLSSALRLLLRAGSDPDGLASPTATVLQAAASHGSAECVRLLLSRWADPDRLAFGESLAPLRLASQMGHLACVDALIGAGAQVDLRCHEGCTALMAAVWSDHVEAAQALVGAGADMELESGAGSAKAMAAKSGQAQWLAFVERFELSESPASGGPGRAGLKPRL